MFKSFTEQEFVDRLAELDNQYAGFLRGNLSTQNVEIGEKFSIVADVPIHRSMERTQDDGTKSTIDFVLIPTTVGNISYRQFANLKPKGLSDLYSRFGGKQLEVTDKMELPRIGNNRRWRLTISETGEEAE